MRLYAGMSGAFVIDTVRNQIARKLSDAFFQYYGYPAAKSEVAAWGNSLRAWPKLLITLASRITASSLSTNCQVPPVA